MTENIPRTWSTKNDILITWKVILLCKYSVQFLRELRVVSIHNKKVLLRESKRHTTCCVASAHCADQSPDRGKGWYPIPSWTRGGGTPSRHGQGRVPQPVLDRGYPIQSCMWGTSSSLDGGVPQGTPILILDGGTPHQSAGWGPDLGWGTPHLDLGWDPPPIQTWDEVSPLASRPGMGYPSPPPRAMVDKVKTLPSVILRLRAVITWAVFSFCKKPNVSAEIDYECCFIEIQMTY